MSHIVTVRAQVRDPQAIRAACLRRQLPAPTYGTAKVFVRDRTGWIVKLNNWKFPVVCDTNTGTVEFDNYEGAWGQPAELDGFLQAYSVEKAKLEARKAGHSVSEQTLTDGSIKLCIQVA
jgi:hypothetical protein